MKQIQRPKNSNKHAQRSGPTMFGPFRHQRRDLEDDAEELLQRDFEDEELFGRMSNKIMEILRYVASSMCIVQTHWRWIPTFLAL